ncbi:MAG: methyl-accepting chemotaxis protein [Dethiobacteria bacterium]|jgi:methyl-accepting chemotaxis protein
MKVGSLKSLKARINLLILALTMVVAVLIGFLLYSKAAAELEESLGVRLMNLAQVSTMFVDVQEHGSLRPGDESSDIYIKIRDILREARDRYGAVYVYTLKKMDENTATFVIDTDNDEPAAIGEEYAISDDLGKAFDGTPSFDQGFYTDKWGTFKSGYAPIFDQTGKVTAVLGVDYDASQVLGVKKDLLLRVLIPMAACLLLCVGCGLWFTRKIILEISDMSSRLKDMSHEVTGNTQDTNTIGQHIVAAFDQLSAGATEQAADLENIGTQIQQFVHSSGQIKSHAQSTSDSSTRVVGVASEGKVLVQAAEKKMDAISDGIISLGGVVASLDQDSHKIEGVVEVISGFAEQTKLLALNAAIEAARAGDAGRGFVVVAAEVGKLADNSGSAVNEVNQLITGIRDKVMETVDLMKQSRQQVEEGTAAFGKTMGALEQIVAHAQNAAALIKQIVEEINRENEAVQKVSQLIQNVADVAQMNAAGSEEVLASISEQAANLKLIAASAGELNDLSAQLSIMVKGTV